MAVEALDLHFKADGLRRRTKEIVSVVAGLTDYSNIIKK
jgi:hypothetical protein